MPDDDVDPVRLRMSIVGDLRNAVKRLVTTPRILKFGLVGLSGVLVNMGVLYFLTEKLAVFYLVSGIIAIECSILSNFALNNLWTWRDRQSGKILHRILRYHAAAGMTALLVNWLLLLVLTEVAGIHYMVSNIIGIGCGIVSNFLLNDLWTFKSRQ
jgi:dolichol-phosphate mannosyltransferase